jgi:hypothetical protein
MHTRPDHLELLALIEGELDAATAGPLRKRLAGEPRVIEAIERMRHDRTALRALGEVQIPTEVLDQLETILARPMLVEPLEPLSAPARDNGAVYATPGQFRRQYRRQALRIRWTRIAVAAALFMVLIAGVWAAINGLDMSPGAPDDRLIVRNDADHMMKASGPANSADIPAGTIHHALPPVTASRPLMAANAAPARRSTAKETAAAGQTLIADFALIVRASDAVEVEASLAAVTEEMDEKIALVRNFSFAEATRIAEELRLARGARRDAEQQPPLVSAGGSRPNADPSLKSLADSVRRQINASAARTSTADASGQISGPAQIAPSLEQQLHFSSRGATHSVAVPVSLLKSFLERAAFASRQSTSLRMMAASENPAERNPLSAWVSEQAQLQQAYDRLRNASPDVIILIPVVIQNN